MLEPLGDSKPDWQITQMIAKELGFDWGYKHPAEIMDEASDLTPMFAGVKYHRLEGYNSLQWPVAADGTDSPLLFTERFNFDNGKGEILCTRFQ